MSDTQYSFFALNKGKIIAAILVILLILGYVFIDIRYKEIEINTGFTPQARQNPYLAAQMFINRMAGLEDEATEQFETYRGLGIINDLPSTQDTLIITTRRHTITAPQVEKLQAWVKQGGHLVLRAGNYVTRPNQKSGDILLDDAGISLYEYDEDNAEAPTPLGVTVTKNKDEQQDNQQQGKSSNKEKQDDSEDLVDEFTPSTIAEEIAKLNDNHLQCSEEALLSSFPTEPTAQDAYAYIESQDFLVSDNNDKIDFWTSDGYGPQIIQLNQGKGRLSVLTSLSLWNNNNIHCFDNAYFLQFVLNYQRPNAGKTWIVFHEDMPGLHLLLWQHHRPLIFSSALLLLAWLLTQSLRFGPIKSQSNIERRSFLEHLEAATRYRWQSGAHQQVIDQLRQQITNKIAQRHGQFEQLPPEQQTILVAQISELDNEQVHHALFATISSNPQHNVQLVRVLQQIRKHL